MSLWAVFLFLNAHIDNAMNQFQQLREQRLQESTREFLARGKSVRRCNTCQLADYACMCEWAINLKAECEFILLMHRNEVFKPTNTGHLIADIFPDQTHVFCWSRTEPDAKLLALLADKNRQCVIVFPVEAAESDIKPRSVIECLPKDEKITTFILLDGTWKQSGRMFHLSRWLDDIPCVALPDVSHRRYAVRKSHQDNYVSTAEAAVLCLELMDDAVGSNVLLDYFQLFNHHYMATRGCYVPERGELHLRLSAFKEK